MTDTQTQPTDFEPGAEVTITVTGRVIHHNSSAVVIEYVKSNGFTDRIAVHNGADVEFRVTSPPDRATLAARERAARLNAVSCADPDLMRLVNAEWVARWNDAYPAGAAVTVTSDPVLVADRIATRTDGWAFLYADRLAAVRVMGQEKPIGLAHVEPAPEEIN